MTCEKEYITTPEAAAFFSISENEVRKMVHKGQLPVHKLGSRNRYKVSECRALFVKKGA
jgi:excisionase family DNA binding protein